MQINNMFENLHEASHLEKSIWWHIILVMHVLEMVCPQ